MDFALTEAAYTVVRLVQEYPTIRLPEGTVPELVGVERQTMTLVISVTEGCKIELGQYSPRNETLQNAGYTPRPIDHFAAE